MSTTYIREQVKDYKAGKFLNPDIDTQIEAGWYDWFCKNSSLKNKTVSLYKKLISIIESKKINIDTQYIFMKNNCPMVGNLYDDFRICDCITGDVIFTIIPKSGHKVANGKGEVWGKENNFKEPIFTGTWFEIKKWFLQ